MNKILNKLFAVSLLLSGTLTAQNILEFTENSPVFSEPNSNSQVLALAEKGERAALLGEERNFFYIHYSSFEKDYYGYIRKSRAQKVNELSGAVSSENNFPDNQSTLGTPLSVGTGITIINASIGQEGEDYIFKDFLWTCGACMVVVGGSTLMESGYVVLGRDIIGLSALTWLTRSRLTKNLRSWGDLDQIEVSAQAYDTMGNPRWTFSPGEQGQIVLTLVNRGEKKVKEIRPRIDVESVILDKRFGTIELSKGKSEGRKRYFVGGFVLDPGESMTTSATFKIPVEYPATSLSVRGTLSRGKYGATPLAVERADPLTPFATAPLPSVAMVDVEKKIPSGKKNADAFAVVFGIEQYKNVSPVSFAQRDAYWVREYFAKTLGVAEENIYYKTDIDVGKAEFDKVFSQGGWLDKRISDGKSDIYIYYAGHGAPDIKSQTAFLIPYDGDPNYASQTGYAVDKMTANLSQLGARSVTVFLDACFSGANRESEILLAGARPVFMDVNTAMADNVTLFSAASGNQISSAWPEKQHGIFSYWLMKGMQGSADANGDQQLTVEELGEFIRENVRTTAGRLDREQTPGVQTLDEEKILISY